MQQERASDRLCVGRALCPVERTTPPPGAQEGVGRRGQSVANANTIIFRMSVKRSHCHHLFNWRMGEEFVEDKCKERGERVYMQYVCVRCAYVWCEDIKVGKRDMTRVEVCAGRILLRNLAKNNLNKII